MQERCIIAARNADGEPDFATVVINCTQNQIDDGKHYEAAKKWALEMGYEEPMVIFDETDWETAFPWLQQSLQDPKNDDDQITLQEE